MPQTGENVTLCFESPEIKSKRKYGHQHNIQHNAFIFLASFIQMYFFIVSHYVHHILLIVSHYVQCVSDCSLHQHGSKSMDAFLFFSIIYYIVSHYVHFILYIIFSYIVSHYVQSVFCTSHSFNCVTLCTVSFLYIIMLLFFYLIH